MQIGFETTAAVPKRLRAVEEQPVQQPIQGDRRIRQAPSTDQKKIRRQMQRKTAGACSCAKHDDGSVTTMLCPTHAKKDPCATMAEVTGQRRRGSIVKGVCSACGWSGQGSSSKTAGSNVIVPGRGGDPDMHKGHWGDLQPGDHVVGLNGSRVESVEHINHYGEPVDNGDHTHVRMTFSNPDPLWHESGQRPRTEHRFQPVEHDMTPGLTFYRHSSEHKTASNDTAIKALMGAAGSSAPDPGTQHHSDYIAGFHRGIDDHEGGMSHPEAVSRINSMSRQDDGKAALRAGYAHGHAYGHGAQGLATNFARTASNYSAGKCRMCDGNLIPQGRAANSESTMKAQCADCGIQHELQGAEVKRVADLQHFASILTAEQIGYLQVIARNFTVADAKCPHCGNDDISKQMGQSTSGESSGDRSQQWYRVECGNCGNAYRHVYRDSSAGGETSRSEKIDSDSDHGRTASLQSASYLRYAAMEWVPVVDAAPYLSAPSMSAIARRAQSVLDKKETL